MRRSHLALFAVLLMAAPLLAGCGGSDDDPIPRPPTDNPPTVVLTAPTGDVTLSGMVPLAATATDDDGIDRVEFRVNGALVGTVDTEPYTMTWDTTGFLIGTYTFSATAFDTADQTDDDSVDAFIFQGHEVVFAAKDSYVNTDSCLTCHEDVGDDLIQTGHWLWEGETDRVAGFEGEVIGKTNLINNFCIALGSNEARCTQCHIGIGWKADPDGTAPFDFDDASGLDCLICHDTTNTYRKNPKAAGAPADGLDLDEIARQVGSPARHNCGLCHYGAGGGDNVKHGDLALNLNDTDRVYDVHMGTNGGDFSCQRCHQVIDHGIGGMPIHHVDEGNMLQCADCHDFTEANPHPANGAYSTHSGDLACQVCHIPTIARFAATKVDWDWSTAGQDIDPIPTDPVTGMPLYNKLKGTFEWGLNVMPKLRRFDGDWTKVFVGEDGYENGAVAIDPVVLATPSVDQTDKSVLIYPFKKMTGIQAGDPVTSTIMVPHLFPYNSEDTSAFWNFSLGTDWPAALQEGTLYNDQPEFEGTDEDIQWIYTLAYLSVNHEVAPKEEALGAQGCSDCHNNPERISFEDWVDLGHDGDPLGG